MVDHLGDGLARTVLVSTAIGMADPGGPFGMMKEGMALAGQVKHARRGEAGELAKEVEAERWRFFVAGADHRRDPGDGRWTY